MDLFTPSHRDGRTAAVAATIGFAGIAIFELGLAAGAPWGHAAYGGATAQLSTAQRAASGVAVIVWTAAGAIVLGRAGFASAGRLAPLFHRGTWALVGVMAIAAVPNFASSSPWENYIFGPGAVALALPCSVVARSAAHGRAGGRRDPTRALRGQVAARVSTEPRSAS
jgi:hypothetical protein